VGTVAPTASTATTRPVDLAVLLFSPVMWVVAAGYAIVGGVLVWVSLLLAPWGLLLLVIAFGALFAAALCAFVAAGISELEADPS
jgi:hypothetical protein